MNSTFKLYLILIIPILVDCSSMDVAITDNKQLIGNMKKIAVMNFEMNDSDPNAQEFSTNLEHQFLKVPNLNVIERDKLVISKVIGEQSLSRSGIIDESTAAKMGKILGVDAIVIGKGERLVIDKKSIDYCLNKFNIKVISVETGNIFINVVKEPGIEWSPWIRTKYILGLGLVWDKNDMLLETCKVNFLAERAVKGMQAKMEELAGK